MHIFSGLPKLQKDSQAINFTGFSGMGMVVDWCMGWWNDFPPPISPIYLFAWVLWREWHMGMARVRAKARAHAIA